MFALRIDLLSGRYVATRYNDREVAEWPPHPARLFSALVAAWAEHEPEGLEGKDERRALEWLEAQPAPTVVADVLDEETSLGRRTVSTVFVPVNDPGVVAQPEKQRQDLVEAEQALSSPDAKERVKAEKGLKKAREALAKRTQAAIEPATRAAPGLVAAALSLLPDGRKRQARTFPSITPIHPEVELHWAESRVPTDLAHAMDRLVARVARLGHSSSFVAVRVLDPLTPPSSDRLFKPHGEGEWTLRWVTSGQTQRLCEYHAHHQQVEPRVMPCEFVSYTTRHHPEVTRAKRPLFDDQWIVLSRVDGPQLPITSVVGVARQLNRALQGAIGKRGVAIPQVVSGHQTDGAPSEQPHLAVVALPFVGSSHADGHLMGLALVLPRAVAKHDRDTVLRALADLELDGTIRLHLGAAGTLGLERVGWEPPRQATLRASTWTRAAQEWISATPIALDANPGDLHHKREDKRAEAFDLAEASVADAAERIGLPRPARVEVSRSVLLDGAAKPRAYPRFPIDASRAQRVLVHARLVFDQAVGGPVLLGAGRFLGLGLCRPLGGGAR